jgi:hypothetical protein
MDDDQRLVLETIYRAFLESGDWPAYGWLERELDRGGVDLEPIVERMESGLVWPGGRGSGAMPQYQADTLIGLRAAGLAACRGSETHLEELVATVQWLVGEWQAIALRSPQDVPQLEKCSSELVDPLRRVLGQDPPLRDLKLMLDLMRNEPYLPAWFGNPDDAIDRGIRIERDIRRFRAVDSIDGLLQALRSLNTTPVIARDVGTSPPLPRRGRQRKYRHQPGQEFGRWTLRSQLGVGGNAEVWEAEDAASGEYAALKLLHRNRTDEEAYARFSREIDAVNRLAQDGARVLPVIEQFLPDDMSATSWYAMPVAPPIRVVLARVEIIDQVAAFAEIADELAQLAQRGWHHRDIKPENLYRHQGRFVVGDFGLVKRPDDVDITRPDRIPGPFHYMPNEVIMSLPDIDRGALDLFCLAKSFWVIVMQEDRPPQGHIAAESRWSISRRMPDEPGVEELDRLIDQVTSDEPDERGTLREFATALAAWSDAGRDRVAIEPRLATVQQPLDPAPIPGLRSKASRDLEALTVDLMRRSDEVGLRELLGEERRRLDAVVTSGVAANHGNMTYGDVAEFWRSVEPGFERVLAVSLPLAFHRSPLWSEHVRWFARFADRRMLESGYTIWIEMGQWCAWLFANTLGAYTTATDNFAILGTLVSTAGPTAEDGVPIGLMSPAESGVSVGTAMMAELDPGRQHRLPWHEYALRYLAEMGWLRQRYPELAQDRSTLVRAFDDFSFLATLAAGAAGHTVVATWTLRHDGAMELARRLRGNRALRVEVAEALGVEPEQLEDNQLFAGAMKPMGYSSSDASLDQRRR